MKILLATDGSKCSENAARFLITLNLTHDDEITVFHVIKPPSLSGFAAQYYSNLEKFKTEIAPKILETTARMLQPANAKIVTQQADGSPDVSIVQNASYEGFDMIIMGARGIRGLKSLFMGNVTRSVVNKSQKPVLVTRPPKWEESETMKILFATDGSDASIAAAQLLSSLPFPEDTEVTLMNVIDSYISEIPERFHMEIDDRIKQDVADARTLEYETSAGIIQKTKPHLSEQLQKTDFLTKIGDPSIEILEQAEKIKADIIAVGYNGTGGKQGMMGSISRRIFRHAPCSVLISKAI
jgi:nucleotide-binding universal stress UspA family protein